MAVSDSDFALSVCSALITDNGVDPLKRRFPQAVLWLMKLQSDQSKRSLKWPNDNDYLSYTFISQFLVVLLPV